MTDTKAKIISNEKAAPEFFRIALEVPGIAKEAKPGQFVMVRCSDGTNPLLRRPFSFHRIGKDGFELLYKVVGKGTKILSQRKKGEVLDVLGPLGKGFNIGSWVMGHGSCVLVAGGTGIAPLLALTEMLTAYSLKLTAYIGARTKNHILCEEEFKKLGAEVQVATEDGSKGHKGLVTELLKDCFAPSGLAMTSIYACGPKPMLKEVAKLANSKNILCQVSLEEKMACGTGACLGCAVKTKKGFKMTCKDGPVFKAEEIIW